VIEELDVDYELVAIYWSKAAVCITINLEHLESGLKGVAVLCLSAKKESSGCYVWNPT
jgi:hypothetical protein